jgi:hypothetical protein
VPHLVSQSQAREFLAAKYGAVDELGPLEGGFWSSADSSVRDEADAWVDASERHHCYELHIGLTASARNVWTGDLEVVRQIATYLAVVLERGPLPVAT